MAVVLLSPAYLSLSVVQKEEPQKSDKSRILRVHDQAAAAGTRSICEDAAGRADPRRHQYRHRERRARFGSASTILAGPCGPIGRCPRHGALGVRKAIRSSAHRCVARDRNPCRGPAIHNRSAGPTARSRLVHGDVSGDDRGAGDLPDGRGRAGHISRHALRQDPLTCRSRGIERGAPISGPSRRTGTAARNSRLSCHRARHRMFALPIIVTGGFGSGLGLALRVLGLEGRKVWMEDPGFPFTPRAPALNSEIVARADPGRCGRHRCGLWAAASPDAALVVVTPGQQSPIGSTLSLARRLRLLDWAAHENAWVIEDDYLSELQLKARAAPALASIDRAGRVIHIGSFSKTMSPTLRLGFLVAPLPLASGFAEVAACLAPAPGPSVQLATAEFMREGHYLRHLRRTKRVYSAQRDALLKYLRQRANDIDIATAGLAALLGLPDGVPDLAIARETLAFGLAPPHYRFGMRRRRQRDPVCCWASRRPRKSISRGPATVFLKSSIASDDDGNGRLNRLTDRPSAVERRLPWTSKVPGFSSEPPTLQLRSRS